MKYIGTFSIIVGMAVSLFFSNYVFSMHKPITVSTISGFQSSRAQGNSHYTSPTKLFKTKVSFLVSELLQNMRSADKNGNIIVTNFIRTMVTGNSNISSEPLSYQLAEELTNQLHRTGFNVIDFKVTDSVRVTPKGDFMLSRDYIELDNNIDAQYVLVGSYDINSDGIVVYSRVVDIESKAVLATSSVLLEHYTVNNWVY